MKQKAGISIIIIGILHSILGFVKFSNSFSEIIYNGFFNTVSGAEKGWALWFTITGIVFILLGIAISFIEKNGLKPPSGIGYILSATAILGGVMLPLSGFWALLFPSVLILYNQNS